MDNFFQKKSLYFIFVLIFTLIFSSMVIAEGLDPEESPGETKSYSMDDLFNRLDTGADGSETFFTEPTEGPGSKTSKTINEIMAKAPSVDDTDGALPEDVREGKTFWGLTGTNWGMRTGTRPNAPVPKTGQTDSYGDEDDGDLKAGVEWPDPRFTDNEDGTVTDNLTGLMWTKNANHGSANHGSMNWDAAINDCNNLDLADYDNWRLPNVRELQSLLDYGEYDPSLPEEHPFEDVKDTYWSSTTLAANTDYAWNVFMHYGYVRSLNKTTTYYVWPVRAGQ